MARRKTELNVDIGKTEIAVKQQDMPVCAGKGMCERDGEPGFPTPPFPEAT